MCLGPDVPAIAKINVPASRIKLVIPPSLSRPTAPLLHGTSQLPVNCESVLREPSRVESQLHAALDFFQDLVEQLVLGNVAEIAEQME